MVKQYQQLVSPRRLSVAALGIIAIISIGFGVYLELASRASSTTWYVAAGGSDSNPCTQASPCLSFDHAYKVAAAGDTVQVASGVYNSPFKNAAGNTLSGEVINWDSAKANATSNVVFQPAPGAAVTVNGNIRVFGSHVTFKDMTLVDPTNSQNKYNVEAYNYDTNGSPSGNDVGNITFQNITARNFEISAAHDVNVLGGSYGPASACQSDDYAKAHYSSKPQYGGDNNAIRAEPGAPDPYNVTVDGATIHNIMSYDLVGCHTEGIAIFSGSNMTIKNSKFYGNDIYNVLAQANSGSKPLGQVTLENNWFAASTSEAGTGSGSWGAELDSISKNVTVANNSFNSPLLFQDPASTVSNVSIVGNILPGPVFFITPSGPIGSMCGRSGAIVQYNITSSASGQNCTTSTNASVSSVSSLYTTPTNDASMKYTLKTGSSPNPIGFVPNSAYITTDATGHTTNYTVPNDIDYHCRPAAGQSNNDAGASELNATGSCGDPITGSGGTPPPPPPPPTPPSPPPTPPSPPPTPPTPPPPGCTKTVSSASDLTSNVNSAAGGTTICITGGTYAGAMTWSGGSNRTSKVVVKPATASDTVVFTGKLTITGSQIELQGDTNGNVSMPNQQYLILAPAHDIQMTNVNTGSFEIQASGGTGTNNITIKGGSIGPWHKYPDNRIDSGGGTAPNTHILIDGVTFHDQTRSNTSDHFECLQVWAADGLTIQNSTFSNCSVFAIFVQSAGSGQPAAPTNVVIQNNFIDCCTDFINNTNSYYKNYAIMLPSDHQEGTWKNVTIRNNTFDDKLDFGSGPAVAFSNVNVKNNIAPGIDYQQSPMTNPVSGLNVDYNLWFSGSKIGSHDLTNANTSSLFANYAALNFHLITGALAIDRADGTTAPTAADPPANFYPPSGSYPLTDKDGNTRPQGAGPDIGADEFQGGGSGDIQKPTAPSNLAATATSSTSVRLNWTAATDNVGVTGYKIYRGGMTTALATVSGSTTTYTDSSVQPNTAYSYQVTAVDAAANESSGSNTANVTTPTTPDTTPPSVNLTAPTNGSSVTGTVTLSASASDGSGINKVEFYVDGTLLASTTTSPYATPWNTNPVSAGSHTIQAKAYDKAGNTANSSTATVTVTHPDTTPPTAPGNLTAQAASPTQIRLAWTPATDNVGVRGYIIRREGIVISTASATTTAFIDASVTGNTTYHYTVLAIDGAGNTSPSSNTATATTPTPPDTTPPAAPGGLTAVAINPTQVNLAWQAASDPSGIKGYNVYRNGQRITSALTPTTTYGDGTVAAATSYTYTVTAVDGASNESARSAPIAVTTPPTSPIITTIAALPTDDSFIEQQYPNRQHGGAKSLQVRGPSTTKDSLLKFQVNGVSGRTVRSAILNLYVTDGAPAGVAFYPIAPGSTWSGQTVTWNNRPAYVATNLLGTLGQIHAGQVVQVDVTKLITADGTYGIFIANTTSRLAAFGSKETGDRGPLLTLKVQ